MPVELENLTQIEEMLIARVFPVMSVYTKPGGQRAYRGHCINFPQEVQQLFYTLPRHSMCYCVNYNDDNRVIVAVTVSALMIMHPEFVCFCFVY